MAKAVRQSHECLQVILCYMYFLFTSRDFGYEQHFDKLAQKNRNLLMHRKGFDQERFEHLKQELRRWQRYAKSLRRPGR